MPEYTDSQRAAIDFRGKKLLVSAAAGSGKTRVLVGRILDRIQLERCDLEDFLVITFTRAAAAELRDRLALELGRRAAESGDRHLRRQLTASKENITTIDGFCAALVREFAHLTDISGRRIASAGEITKLREQARAAALDRIYSSDDPDILAAAAALGYGRADRKFAEAMEKLYDHTREHPYPDRWRDKVLGMYGSGDFAATPFGAEVYAAVNRILRVAVSLSDAAIELMQDDAEMSAAYLPAFGSDRDRMTRAIAALERQDVDEAFHILTAANTKLGALRGRGDDPKKKRVQDLRKKWDDTRKRAAKLLIRPEEGTRELAAQLPAIRGLFRAAGIFGEEFDRVKALRRVAEFLDYSHAAIKLLSSPAPDGGYEPSAIARTVSARFKEVLVDEFQDTNELQTLICDLLTDGDGGSLFMVGDVKQSIYRFRLARPDIFLARYNEYPPIEEGGDSAVAYLSQNFRSRSEVIGPINYFFRRALVGGASEITYDRGQYLYPGREDEPRADCTTEFCILNAADAGDDDESASSSDRTALEAKYVAERIAGMLREGFSVPDQRGSERPLRPEDVAILLRSPKNRAWMYRQALENMGIPCSSGEDGGAGAELMTLLSVLTAIDNPYLDVPLVGAMLSPVFGFSADELALIRSHSPGAPTIYASVTNAARDGSRRASEFVARLDELRRAAGSMPPDKLLLKLYAESGIVGIYSALENGEARRERLNLVYLAARRYSRESRYRLHGFIEYLEGAISRGEFVADTSGGEGVRVMSIHKSKGLEFAVVFCSSLGGKINFESTGGDLLIHPELGVAMKIYDSRRHYVYPSGAWSGISERIRCETIAEELRMLYVAMTRAREKLILTCVLPDAESSLANILRTGWLGESSLAGVQTPAHILIPLAAEHPDGAVLRTVADRAATVPLEEEGGRILVRLIGLLREDGTRRTEAAPTLTPPEPDTEVYRVLAENLSYCYPHPELAELPSKLTATQLKGLRTDDDEDNLPEVDDTEDADDTPRRKFVFQRRRPRIITDSTELTPTERGTAIHTAMQFADYARCATEEGALGELERLEQERYLTPVQAEAVRREIDKICAFAASDLCRRALASPNLRREFKFSILDRANLYFSDAPEDKTVLLQGVCDMFFEEGGGITVVDFKSDRVSADTEGLRAAEYAPQLDAYARALGRIFGLEVRKKVIYFFATGHEVELE